MHSDAILSHIAVSPLLFPFLVMYLKLQRGSGNGSGAATGTGGGAGNVTVREGVRVGKNMENKYEDAKSVERVVRNCVGNMENNQRAKRCCYGE